MSKVKSPLFVMIERSVLDSAAWRAMSTGARVLYLALRRRYNQNFHNNGKIYISVRDAAKELGVNKNKIADWYHELQHFGFIIMSRAGNLGIEGAGRAAHWRLTEVGYMKEPPTRDFERWNGKPYVSKNRDVRKRIIQPPRRDDKNQNPVPDARTDRPGMPDMRRPGARDGHPADCPGEWDIQGIGSSRRTVHN